jgi:hypothetical protein
VITSLALALIGLAVAGTLTHRRNAAEARRAMRDVHGLGGGGGRIPILMPVCGRPHYLRQVIAALSEVKDIDKSVLIVSQDGQDEEVSALVAGIRFTDVVVLRHTRPFLGVFAYFWDSLHAASANIRFLLDFAFDGLGAEHAIVLEDDIVPSPDFLRFFAWGCRHILNDEQVLSVTGFNLHSRVSPEHGFDPRDHPHDMVENRDGGRAKFTGWSWAISAATWRKVRDEWSDLSWDTRLDEAQRRRGMISWKPVLARAKNIGMQGGINFTEAERNPKWADLVLAEDVCSDDAPPRLLADDPVRPPFAETAPAAPIRNERERTRARRLGLLAVVAAMTVVELLAWGTFGS